MHSVTVKGPHYFVRRTSLRIVVSLCRGCVPIKQMSHVLFGSPRQPDVTCRVLSRFAAPQNTESRTATAMIGSEAASSRKSEAGLPECATPKDPFPPETYTHFPERLSDAKVANEAPKGRGHHARTCIATIKRKKKSEHESNRVFRDLSQAGAVCAMIRHYGRRLRNMATRSPGICPMSFPGTTREWLLFPAHPWCCAVEP